MITTKNGLLYRDDKIISLPEADEVARINEFIYVERLIRAMETGLIKEVKDIKIATNS
jgi:hypothetical protein